MTAPQPRNEKERLEALRRYEILDTLREAEFDDLARLAAHICQTPVSLITLIDADRQWFKSAVGWEGSETPREIAFCAYTILGSDLLIIPDASKDERFAGNPQVTSEPHIRFYAGVPLITPDAYALGSLCVIDTRPRNLRPEQREALAALGRQVTHQLQARLTAMRLERELAERALAEKRLRESEAALRRAHDELEKRVLERTEQLARATRAAEAASRAKSDFLATMSHELRTPLNHIIGYSEMLAEEAEDLGQEQLRPDLEKIRSSGKHLLELVEAVLEITRTERGEVELHPEEVSISELLCEVVDAVRERIEQRGNTLRLVGAVPAGTMRVD
ncbi:MAG TPA: histidine kinase dimerization/phospho-acceptor domain-containing protein, partial [Longimicrobiaceae bacterium]|nr:histidine kinase dimerization/phospho-acceptor domain-containing protein [Longimicrobiaceae bacterium]